jgi:carboxymethylenebutenolidase
VSGYDIAVKAGDGAAFEAYLVGDTSLGRPAVVLFPPIFGVDAGAKAIADRWAERGYLVAVPDYFFRIAPGVLDRSESGRKLAMERWKKLDAGRTIEDMRSLKDHLLSRSCCNGAFASLGFCAGGELAFLASTRLGAQAVTTFHATHIDRHLDEAAKIGGRVSLHYGGSDSLVPMSEVDAIRERLSSDSRVDIHIYPGAGHGFSFQGQPSFHEVAATESDLRAQEVLGELKLAA